MKIQIPKLRPGAAGRSPDSGRNARTGPFLSGLARNLLLAALLSGPSCIWPPTETAGAAEIQGTGVFQAANGPGRSHEITFPSEAIRDPESRPRMSRSAVGASDRPSPGRRVLHRGLWVWDTEALLGSPTLLRDLTSQARTASVTDVYLFLRASDISSKFPDLQRTIQVLKAADLHVWSMEGWRGYFSDGEGPEKLYAAADMTVAYNRQSGPSALFAGFVSDLEPHDGQDPAFATRFHNDIPDSLLDTEQAQSRRALMGEWLEMHRALSSKMHAAGLMYGAAVPFWMDNYQGEPVHVDDGKGPMRVSVALMRTVCPSSDALRQSGCWPNGGFGSPGLRG